ncbi:MAG TPA: L,D-transpeptidase [Thermoanaerobaculia bacterium]|nr:L,D-transpeptidase [Thermoanaerobaculia bacterium]
MNLTQLAAILTMTAGTAAAEVPARRLVISIADRKVVLIENGSISKIYDIAVGASRTPSPRGNFALANRVVHPTWYGPKVVVAPGPANPLGTRWMGLGYRGYGLHGTNNPNSIGKAASHGCFRMRNEDAEELFELVKVGDPVEIVEEPRPQITTPVYAFVGPVRGVTPATLATVGAGE